MILITDSLAVSDSELNIFIFGYLKRNETFIKTPFNLSDGQYYIVSIGEPAMIIRATSNGSMQVIRSRSEIRNALLAYYGTQGIGGDLKLNKSYSDELASFVDSFNKSRKSEFECKKYIGIDRFPCVNLETCWRACYTPICQQMKVGAGEPFLDLVWVFSNETSYIDSNYSGFREKVSQISEWKSQEQIDELIGFIDNMFNDSVKIGGSDLFNPMALGFCPVLDSDLSYLIQAKIRLLEEEGKVAPMLGLDYIADMVSNNTVARVGLSKNESCSVAVSGNMLEVSHLKNEFSSLNNSGMNDRLSELGRLAKLDGCVGMNELQLRSARQNFSNFSQQTEEYGSELIAVMGKEKEVKSILASVQADAMLYFKSGEFSSRFDKLSSEIDSAKPEQLPALESQLNDLEAQMQSSSQNRYWTLLSGICLPLLVVLAVIAVVIYAVKIRKRR